MRAVIRVLGDRRRKFDSVKSVRIRSFTSPYFPAFGLNTEIYRVNLPIKSECGKIRTKKTLNTDTFYTVCLDNICFLSTPMTYFCLNKSIITRAVLFRIG